MRPGSPFTRPPTSGSAYRAGCGLRDSAAGLRRILVHELFHFAWASLGNPTTQSWARVIEAEWNSRARGELGWSAEYRKEGRCAAYRPESDYSSRSWRRISVRKLLRYRGVALCRVGFARRVYARPALRERTSGLVSRILPVAKALYIINIGVSR